MISRSFKLLIGDLNAFLNMNNHLNKNVLHMFDVLQGRKFLLALTTSHSENVVNYLKNGLAPDILITCDGASAKQKTVPLYKAMIPNAMANEIISLIVNSGDLIDLTADSPDYFFSMRPSTQVEHRQGYSNTVVTDFTGDIERDDILKITARLSNSRIAYKIVDQYPDVYLTEFTSERGYQFKSIGAKKHHALTSVCTALKIELKDIIAFGCNPTDIGILTLVRANGGCTIATTNASIDCIRSAEFICDDNTIEGITAWVENNVEK
jgi:hydroxymethylpyrimidine pyrophosphatase-like HAD family hydrolase